MNWSNLLITVGADVGVVGALGLMVRDVARTHRGTNVAALYLQALELSTPWGEAPALNRLPWYAQRVARHETRKEAFRAMAARKGMAELSAMVADPEVGQAPGQVVTGQVVTALTTGSHATGVPRPRATQEPIRLPVDQQWWRKDNWQQPAQPGEQEQEVPV